VKIEVEVDELPGACEAALQSIMESGKEPLVGEVLVVYRRRWFILALFSFLALYQCCVWNTWGPVVNSVQAVYGWDTVIVSLFANWGSIAFLVFMVPTLYLQDINLRATVLLSSGLVALATSIRCSFLIFPDIPDSAFTILCHVSAILNGIPGIVVTSAPAAVSAAWFPPQERVTATSISQMLNNVGQGVSFLVASLMVEEPGNGTGLVNSTSPGPGVEEVRAQLQHYLLLLAVPAITTFLLALLYFPSKPPTAPSRSSQEPRLDFATGVKQLVSNPNSWALAVVWAVPQAVWNNWCALMVISLTKISMDGEFLSETWVSQLGLVAVLVSTATAITVGTCIGRIRGSMKTTILGLLVAGGAMFSLLSLVTLKVLVLPSMLLLKTCVYIFLLLGNSCVVSTSPLLFEFGVEKLYPISEGLIGGWLNIWYNIISVIFLGLFSIPHIGSTWLSYVLPFSCFSVLPILLVVKEEYKRRSVDDEEKEEEESTGDGEEERRGSKEELLT